MGLNLEPKTDKSAWIKEHGDFIEEGTWKPDIEFDDASDDDLIVCLVNNGMLYALEVAFSKDELYRLKQEDGRHKIWYFVDKAVIKSVAPDYDNYVKG